MTDPFDSSNLQYSDSDYTFEGTDTTEEGKKSQSGHHSIGYKYEIYNPNTGTSFVINYIDDNDEGIGLSRSPEMACDIRTREQNKDGQHGTIGFRSFYGARALTFDCQVVAATAEQADKIIDNIKRTVALPPQPTEENKGDVRIRWTDVQGKKWQVYARPINDPQPTSSMNMWLIHNIQLQFKAYDPVIYAQEESTLTAYQGWIQGSFFLNTDLPFYIPYYYNYKATIDNAGTFQTPTIIKLYGYARKPAVYNISTGARLVIDYEVEEGDYITIDSLQGTITNSNGADIASLTTSDDIFIFLQVGQNEIIYYDAEQSNNPYITGESDRLETTTTKINTISGTNRNWLVIDHFTYFNHDGSWGSDYNDLFQTGTTLETYNNLQNAEDGYLLIENSSRASQDWTNYYNTGTIRLKINFNNEENIASITLRFGSSTSDYYYKTETTQFDSSAIADGDNIFEFDLASTSSTGSPDKTDITYFAVQVTSSDNFGRQQVSNQGGILRSLDDATGNVAQTSSGWIEDEKYGWYLNRVATAVSAEFDSAVQRTGTHTLKLSTTDITGRAYTSTMNERATTYVGTKNKLIPIKSSTKYQLTCYVKTDNVASDSVYIRAFQWDNNYANRTISSSSKLSGTNDWTLLSIDFTTGATISYLGIEVEQEVAGNISDAWFDINSMILSEIIEDTNYSGDDVREADIKFTAVSTTDNIDQSLDAAASYSNTYALPTSTNEGATHRQTFTPTKLRNTKIGIYIVDKGTGNWRIRVHNSGNSTLATISIANASLTNSAFNYFDLPFIWTSGALHFHVYSTGADGTLKTNTTDDLEDCSFIHCYAKNSENYTCELNGDTLDIDADEYGFNHGSYIDLSRKKYYYSSDHNDNVKYRISDIYSTEIAEVLTLSSGYISTYTNQSTILKFNTGLPIIGLSVSATSSGITGSETQVMSISTDNITYTTLSTLTGADGTHTADTDLINGYTSFYLKFISTGGYTHIDNITIDADLNTTSLSKLYYQSGQNDFYVSSNSTNSVSNTDPSLQMSIDYMPTKEIDYDGIYRYADNWTLSGNAYDDEYYKVEDHGIRITSSGGTSSYAFINQNINLSNASLEDILSSYQYIDDYTQLDSYKIRFGDDTNYADVDLVVPTANGWTNNKIRFENFTLGGTATVSGTFSQIRLYAQSTISGVVNVTYAGIYHIETDTMDALDTQAMIINWREAQI